MNLFRKRRFVVFPDATTVKSIQGGAHVPVLHQGGFRRRDDDVGINSTTWNNDSGVNTNFSQDAGVNFRVRFALENQGGANTGQQAYKFQFNHEGAGFVDVGSTTPLQFSLSDQFTDDENITSSQISGSTGTFVTGFGNEGDNVISDAGFFLDSGIYRELEGVFIIDEAQIAEGEQILLRLVISNGTVLDNYDATPTITITIPETPVASARLSPIEILQSVESEPEVYNLEAGSETGTPLSLGSLLGSGMAAMTPTRIAWADLGIGELRMYEWGGSSWSLVGSGLSISGFGKPAIARLGDNRVVFIEGASTDAIRIYDFNGSTWSEFGTGTVITGMGNPACAALSSTRIAFIDNALDSLRTYDYNGSSWDLVGSGLSVSNTSAALAAMTSNRVAIIQQTHVLGMYEFNGSTWSLVGSTLDLPTTGNPGLTSISSNTVVFANPSDDELQTFRFNGSSWAEIGTPVSVTSMGNPSIARMSPLLLAFLDETNEELAAHTVSEGDAEEINYESIVPAIGGLIFMPSFPQALLVR